MKLNKNYLFFLKKMGIVFFTINIILFGWFFTKFLKSIEPYIGLYLLGDTMKYFESQNTKSLMRKSLVINYMKMKNPQNKKNIIKNLKSKNIGYIEIKIPNANLKDLSSNLPISGKKYEKAEVRLDNDEWIKAELKYRGDFFYHWGFDKKSLGVKLLDKDIKINLVNPKTKSFIAEKVANDLAKNEFGLIAPEIIWEGVFINDEFMGVFLKIEDINDSFAERNNLSSIFEGEKVSFSDTSGLDLFKDYKKWELAAGTSSNQDLIELIKYINIQNNPEIISKFNSNYMARFYSFVSFVENSHFDQAHNWFLGLSENYIFPIVWDSVPWIQSANKGNRIEETASPISASLRKNIFFNQLFSNLSWNILNDDFKKNILEYIENERETLLDILKFDLLKGSAFQNPTSTRYPQSVADIDDAISELKIESISRIEEIRSGLSDSSAQIFLIKKDIYIAYSGISAASLINTKNNSFELEVYNFGQFTSFDDQDLSKNLLFGGRSTLGSDHLSYASNCTMFYKIKNASMRIDDLILLHTLTNEKIPLVTVDNLSVGDCNMDLTPIEKNKPDNINFSQNKKTNFIKMKTGKNDTNKILNFFEKVSQKVVIEIGNKKYQAKLDKDKFSQNLSLKLDETYDGNLKFWLVPFKSLDINNLNKIIGMTTKAPFIVNQIKYFPLSINNFDVGDYFLIPKLDKPLMERNGLSWDTDIFRKDGFNTADINSFKKVSSKANTDGEDFSQLKKLISSVEAQSSTLTQYLDLENIIDNYNFMYKTGNDNLGYALYYDQTNAKFKIIPLLFSFYNNDDWQVKDPLLKNIFNYFKKENLIVFNETEDQYYLNKSNHDSDQKCETNLGEINNLISGNQLTFKINHNYFIDEDLIIPDFCDVVIESGVIIAIAPKKSIVSYGKVTALGTNSFPILVKSQDSSKPFGSFALVESGADSSELSYFNITNGSETIVNGLYLSGMLSVYHADDVVVRNSVFKNAQADDALNFKYSNSSVYDSLFEDNSADAIDFDYMSGEISGNTFINNGNDSIDTSGSTTLVKNNYIKDSGDKCISVGEKSYLTITNNVLDGCNIGIEAKDESAPVITHNLFKNNKVALNAYQKKDFFGPAYPEVYYSLFINNDENITLKNTFEGKKLKSDDSKIEIFNSIFDEESVDNSIGLLYPNLVPQSP